MNVMVIGGGAREHAIIHALTASPSVDAVWCAPGNAGIALDAPLLAVAVEDIDGLVDAALAHDVDLVVVGPERPLALGIVDRLEAAGITALGPSAGAAQLESSKAFAKAFCARHGIRTAGACIFEATDLLRALAWATTQPLPLVVKADGLASGKGVVVATSRAEFREALSAFANGAFGSAGETVVVETFLPGEEASLFALCDGRDAIEIGTAQDHKRAHDGDLGPNTGGMGACSPAPMLTPDLRRQVMAEIVQPTLGGMAAEGRPFKGFLYVGLMLGDDGPKLVEFNARMGDPECQAILPRLASDIAPWLLGAARGKLPTGALLWRPASSVTVVLASRGYPGEFERGSQIQGLDAAAACEGVQITHAATRHDDGRWLADGGRVLGVTGVGPDLASARARAYAAVDLVSWPAGFCRRDIGLRALHDACVHATGEKASDAL